MGLNNVQSQSVTIEQENVDRGTREEENGVQTNMKQETITRISNQVSDFDLRRLGATLLHSSTVSTVKNQNTSGAISAFLPEEGDQVKIVDSSYQTLEKDRQNTKQDKEDIKEKQRIAEPSLVTIVSRKNLSQEYAKQ